MRNVLASEGTRFLGVAIMEFLEKFWRGVLEFGVRKPRVVFSRITFLSGIHPEFSFPVIPDMFTYPERCPPALSVYVLTHPDP